MIQSIARWAGIAGLLTFGAHAVAAGTSCPDLLSYTFPVLQDGKPMPLCQYQGKVMLVVNTASYCGFTSQYDGLEKLYARLKDKGLVVVGFPTNDFGEQEPGSNKEIADFCRLTYGVQFPMAGKTTLKGKDANPFFSKLESITGSKPAWNFHKYLIARDGKRVIAFPSETTPNDPVLLKKIEDFISQP
jgi:glutathione peroxidase